MLVKVELMVLLYCISSLHNLLWIAFIWFVKISDQSSSVSFLFKIGDVRLSVSLSLTHRHTVLSYHS